MRQLKYNIRERLDALNRREHEIMMRRLLEAVLPASRSTFYRWINTGAGDVFQIPYTKQLKIAVLFGCTVDELSYVP
ncbi:hypothetical protein [Taibaiella koreensis]|uniref:hypothetical protein n=1 Tax=Taibaiella koreensis TaxID=1268548 RepID=UPI0013C352C7|nr:hypothetical protein [Taibaiella koreensis]